MKKERFHAEKSRWHFPFKLFFLQMRNQSAKFKGNRQLYRMYSSEICDPFPTFSSPSFLPSVSSRDLAKMGGGEAPNQQLLRMMLTLSACVPSCSKELHRGSCHISPREALPPPKEGEDPSGGRRRRRRRSRGRRRRMHSMRARIHSSPKLPFTTSQLFWRPIWSKTYIFSKTKGSVRARKFQKLRLSFFLHKREPAISLSVCVSLWSACCC